MSPWICDGLYEDQLGVRLNRVSNSINRRRIHKGHAQTVRVETVEEAVRVAEQKRTGDKVVAVAQQRKQHGADGGHACTKTDRIQTLFHKGDLRLQRGYGWVYLPAVGKTFLLSLKDFRQVMGVGVPICDGGVHRFVQRAMFDGITTV